MTDSRAWSVTVSSMGRAGAGVIRATGPGARPALPTLPRSSSGIAGLLRVQVAGEQLGERVQRLLRTRALGLQDDLGALPGTQGQHREHARGRYGLAVADPDPHRNALVGGGLDEQRRGPGVQARTRGDLYCPLGHACSLIRVRW